MAKKKTPRQQNAAPRQAAPDSAARTSAAPAAAPVKRTILELVRHPILVAAGISLAITLFAAGAAIKFHDDMSMGAIREPTGIILWAAVTFTLFARYWRERTHPPKSDS